MGRRGYWPLGPVIAIAVLASCAAPPIAPTPIPSATSVPTPVGAIATAPSAPSATSLPAISTVAPTARQQSAMATPSPLALPPSPAASLNGPTAKVDMDKIFPPGKGRDLVLYNCIGCHSFVRLVIGQRTVGAWEAVRRRMGPRASGLGEQELDDLFAYLEQNFNDTKPVPSVPDWLLSSY